MKPIISTTGNPHDDPSPSVLIIILNWNGKEDTLACLKSLQQIDYPNANILVIDNASEDDSLPALRRAYPGIRLIENARNRGFVGANNQGLEIALKEDYTFALLLNNDTEVAPDFLSLMVRAAQEDPRAGAIGPFIYYFDKPGILWSAGGRIDWEKGEAKMMRMGMKSDNSDTTPYSADFVSGCALLVNMKTVSEIGLLDERFFLYYEETEWCVRAGRAGYKIAVAPAAKVWHKISSESREDSPMVQYYMTRNRLLFLRCTHAALRAWIAALFENARTLLSWSLRPKWKHKSPQRRAKLRAILDFSRGRLGEAENIF